MNQYHSAKFNHDRLNVWIETKIFQTAKEFDFLVLSKQLRSVVQIEVKLSNSGLQRRSASEQLDKGFQFLQKTVPFPGNEDWHFVKTIYFGLNKEEVCQDCSGHVIGPDSDLNLWWDNIKRNNEKNSGICPMFQGGVNCRENQLIEK